MKKRLPPTKQPSAALAPIAVVDVGSHFVRLEIVQLNAEGGYTTLESLTQEVPLGIDVFTKWRISFDNILLVSEILKDFSKVVAEYGIVEMEALATSAVREAANSDLFIDTVRRVSGITLKLFEAPEESRMLFQAVKASLGTSSGFLKGKSAICNIGTGSTQISFIDKGMLMSSETVSLGSLRLLEELEEPFSSRKLRETMDPFVGSMVRNVVAQSPERWARRDTSIIAAGSAVRTLLAIATGRKREQETTGTLSKKSFEKVFDEIAGVEPYELAERHDISDMLARSLEPTCVILHHFILVADAERLIIPAVTTRDAIIQDIIRRKRGEADTFSRQLISCAMNLGEKFNYDRQHCHAVMKLAELVFEKTQQLHELGPRDLELLKVAALLHDIGLYLNSRQHHKHSYYLINNSQLPGLSRREQEIIAVTARYHRRSLPKSSHPEYVALPPEDKILMSKLAAILRIADSLDFIQKWTVTGIDANLETRCLEIIVDGPQDMALENWTVRRKANFFREVFGLKVLILGGKNA